MPFPIAHGFIGAAIVTAGAPSTFKTFRQEWKRIALGAFLAISPDLDYICIWLFGFEKNFHRGFSHSISLPVIIGGLYYLLMSSGNRFRWALVYALAMASHGLLDTLVSVKGGVELLWPVLSHRFTSGLFEYPDMLGFSYYTPQDILVIKGLARFILISSLEFFVAGSIFIITHIIRRKFSP
jgi:membrane-bound metal-dependent hydrolase YbcI (DUF457 family)